MSLALSSFDLSGKTALITHANKGIGKAIAVMLANCGADIIDISSHIQKNTEVEKEVIATGRKFIACAVDVSNHDELYRFIQSVKSNRSIDILVNNTGIVVREPATEHSDEYWNKVLSINFISLPDKSETATTVVDLKRMTDKDFLTKLVEVVEEYMDSSELSMDMLSRKMAMSLPVLYKRVKVLTNMTVNNFIKSLRLKKAAELLKQKGFTVNEICCMVGYRDRKYFSKEFKKYFGKTPTDFDAIITDVSG